MPCLMKMFGHVLVRRLIATERCATGLAGTQVHPVAANFNAFLTFISFGLLEFFDAFYMGAGRVICHGLKNESSGYLVLFYVIVDQL